MTAQPDSACSDAREDRHLADCRVEQETMDWHTVTEYSVHGKPVCWLTDLVSLKVRPEVGHSFILPNSYQYTLLQAFHPTTSVLLPHKSQSTLSVFRCYTRTLPLRHEGRLPPASRSPQVLQASTAAPTAALRARHGHLSHGSRRSTLFEPDGEARTLRYSHCDLKAQDEFRSAVVVCELEGC